VLEVVQAFETVTGRPIPRTIAPRRDGDVARLEGCSQLAAATLGWRASRSLEQMCRDGWAWQSANPQGYDNRTSV
jgi:UDP-glucose 4-epimerase